MIESKEISQMVKKSSEEIISLLRDVLSSEAQSLSKLSTLTKELDVSLQHETIERYIKLIVQIQSQFKDITVHYEEHKIADRTYKTAWFEEED